MFVTDDWTNDFGGGKTHHRSWGVDALVTEIQNFVFTALIHFKPVASLAWFNIGHGVMKPGGLVTAGTVEFRTKWR
jgi:hypothetical protein